MQNNMKTSERPTSLSGKTVSTCLPADSRASRSRSQESGEAQKTIATCGPRCSTLFGLFDPAGSWARTFTESLIGRKGWSSNRCALTWRRQDTVRPYIIPACGVGAPHRRDRCWFVAHRTDAGSEAMREREDGFYAVEPVAHPDGDRRRKRPNEQKPLPECVGTSDAGNGVENGIVAYFDRQRCEECNASCQSGHTQRTTQNSDAKRRIPDWNGFPTQPLYVAEMMGFPGIGWYRLSSVAPGSRQSLRKRHSPAGGIADFETINEYEKI